MTSESSGSASVHEGVRGVGWGLDSQVSASSSHGRFSKSATNRRRRMVRFGPDFICLWFIRALEEARTAAKRLFFCHGFGFGKRLCGFCGSRTIPRSALPSGTCRKVLHLKRLFPLFESEKRSPLPARLKNFFGEVFFLLLLSNFYYSCV